MSTSSASITLTLLIVILVMVIIGLVAMISAYKSKQDEMFDDNTKLQHQIDCVYWQLKAEQDKVKRYWQTYEEKSSQYLRLRTWAIRVNTELAALLRKLIDDDPNSREVVETAITFAFSQLNLNEEEFHVNREFQNKVTKLTDHIVLYFTELKGEGEFPDYFDKLTRDSISLILHYK